MLQNEMSANRVELHEIQFEHKRLLRQQEVLQAELKQALNVYQPKASIKTGGWAYPLQLDTPSCTSYRASYSTFFS